MNLYHCECDPHGDNAKCDRPCCRSQDQRKAEIENILEQARRAQLKKESQNADDNEAAARDASQRREHP